MRQARQRHTTSSFEIRRQAPANFEKAATYNRKRERFVRYEMSVRMMLTKLLAQLAQTIYFAESSKNVERVAFLSSLENITSSLAVILGRQA